MYIIPSLEEVQEIAAKKAPKKKPLCKWGERDADGFCPPKPSASTAATGTSSSKPPKPKPPCKWGPRDANGYCPSKPKANPFTQFAEKQAGKIGGQLAVAGVDIAFEYARNPEFKAAVQQSIANGKQKLLDKAGTIGAGIAGIGLAGGAAVAAAGVTAFLGTQFLANKVAEAKAAGVRDVARRNNIARDAWIEAVDMLRELAQRDTTEYERTVLYNKFFDVKKPLPPKSP